MPDVSPGATLLFLNEMNETTGATFHLKVEGGRFGQTRAARYSSRNKTVGRRGKKFSPVRIFPNVSSIRSSRAWEKILYVGIFSHAHLNRWNVPSIRGIQEAEMV